MAVTGTRWDGALDRIDYALWVRCRKLADREASPTSPLVTA